MECGRDEVGPAIGVGAVGSVQKLGVGIVEEERRAAPDPGDGVQPPPGKAQNLVTEAIGLRLSAAQEDEPCRRRSRRRGGRSRAVACGRRPVLHLAQGWFAFLREERGLA